MPVRFFRIVMVLMCATSWTQLSAATAGVRADAFANKAVLRAWIKSYRATPEPERLSDAVTYMRAHGLVSNEQKAGLYIGFTAGILGDNPDMAEDLVASMFPMPPKEQVLIIKALAYSGLPNWKELLGRFAERMPARLVQIDSFLFKDQKTMMDVPLDADPAILDTLWGYYVATGRPGPVRRIVEALQWAEGESYEKVFVAQTASWTLAANAERDRELLTLYRRIVVSQPKAIRAPLKEVISAAQEFRSERIRDKAQVALEQAKRNANSSAWSKAGQVGSTVLSVGCVAAGALGHPEIAAPCIITGALYSGAVKLFSLAK